MQIAFHAPLKPPGHAVASGDRLMARQILVALAAAGHDVRLASELRTRLADPSAEAMEAVEAEAEAERERLEAQQAAGAWRPELWLTYHLYYKAPDLIGPAMAERLRIPYVAIEASHAAARETGPYARWAAHAARAMRNADLLVAMTQRDLGGLQRLAGRRGALALLPPFLADPGPEPEPRARRAPGAPVELVTVAMMRSGFKLDSYRLLAEALPMLPQGAWRLTVLGDGPAAGEVARLLGKAAMLARADLRILGAHDAMGVRAAMDAADIFAWPGVKEPYGMVYLEAAARGLPVVALSQGGVPDMVRDGVTGLLAPGDTAEDYAGALAALIADPDLRAAMGAAGRRFAIGERSLASAAATLDALLVPLVPRRGEAA